MPGGGSIRWREIGADRAGDFLVKGHRQRSFFPHRFALLPRPGPDGYKLARRMCGEHDPSALWEVVLFADAATFAEFPSELSFDDDVVWHRQHFGRPGQVAYADVVVSGADMWSMSHVSDLVQRIGRRRQHKTRIENRFKGWPDMLLNALLAFAVERGVRWLRIPRSQFQMKHTDAGRSVQPELFERVYDRSVNRLLSASPAGDWWLVDVPANSERLVVPTMREERLATGRTICLCHDVEAGLGHAGFDPGLVERANRSWRDSVASMLRCERERGIRATYNVVGRLLPEVQGEIEADGHCLAFHSYDHRIDPQPPPPPARQRFLPRRWRVPLRRSEGDLDQLAACRRIDYRLKGYRVPQSRITPEFADENLLFHNFEWLASSRYSLGVSQPELRNGIVRIPVHADDFELYRGGVDYESWRAQVIETVATHDVAVVSAHDCYAHLWLDRYPELLEELSGLGELRTLDDLAADITLAQAL